MSESTSARPPAADQALQRLLDGHRRYLEGHGLHLHQSARWRAAVAQGQHPFAMILGCADSRVPPEIVFDQGLGDLFVIRTAGHVLDGAGLGSVEYALEELEIPLVMVLGHERCGAVQAAVQARETGRVVSGHLGSIVAAIAPAVADAAAEAGDLVDNAVRANVFRVIRQLEQESSLLALRVAAGSARIVGARHDLDTGEVELLA